MAPARLHTLSLAAETQVRSGRWLLGYALGRVSVELKSEDAKALAGVRVGLWSDVSAALDGPGLLFDVALGGAKISDFDVVAAVGPAEQPAATMLAYLFFPDGVVTTAAVSPPLWPGGRTSGLISWDEARPARPGGFPAGVVRRSVGFTAKLEWRPGFPPGALDLCDLDSAARQAGGVSLMVAKTVVSAGPLVPQQMARDPAPERDNQVVSLVAGAVATWRGARPGAEQFWAFLSRKCNAAAGLQTPATRLWLACQAEGGVSLAVPAGLLTASASVHALPGAVHARHARARPAALAAGVLARCREIDLTLVSHHHPAAEGWCYCLLGVRRPEKPAVFDPDVLVAAVHAATVAGWYGGKAALAAAPLPSWVVEPATAGRAESGLSWEAAVRHPAQEPGHLVWAFSPDAHEAGWGAEAYFPAGTALADMDSARPAFVAPWFGPPGEGARARCFPPARHHE